MLDLQGATVLYSVPNVDAPAACRSSRPTRRCADGVGGGLARSDGGARRAHDREPAGTFELIRDWRVTLAIGASLEALWSGPYRAASDAVMPGPLGAVETLAPEMVTVLNVTLGCP